MSTNAYTSTYTDELEALGNEEIPFDTSAAIGPEDDFQLNNTVSYKPPDGMASSRRWCFICTIIVVVAAIATAVAAIFFFRNNTNDAKTDQTSNSPQSQPIVPGTAPSSSTSNQTTNSSPHSVTTSNTPIKTYAVNILNKYPHDKMAFTQGFEYSNGVFYESTGLRGRSSLRKVEISTGKVLKHYDFPDMTLFGEGMTLHTTHHIFMLTWEAGRGFIFNQSTFELIKEWKYEGEGWGLTMDRKADEVYMSDGTSQLRILDPEDLSEKRRITVTNNGRELRQLNELEWVCGEVWANVWQTTKIVRIDPKTGNVKSVIDASNLPLPSDRHANIDVLNGIAFDKSKGRLWFTGKNWPSIYEVSITDDSLDLSSCQ